MARHWFRLSSIVVALLVALIVGGTPSAHAADPTSPRYFSQTGFSVDNDAIWDFFNHRGGVATFGYPVSGTFLFEGFTVQFFQRQVVQLDQNGAPRLLNELDPGLMPYTVFNGATIPAIDGAELAGAPPPSDQAATLAFVKANAPDVFEGLPVNFYQTFKNTVPMSSAFPNGGDAGLLPGFDLELWGIPTSRPAFDPNNHNFVYLRFQRGIMMYDDGCKCTQPVLIGDYLKSILTDQNIPKDLEEEAKNSPLFNEYLAGSPDSVRDSNALPNTNMTNAFTPQAAVASGGWIHTNNGVIVDAANNRITLRGFVTITNDTDGTPVTYTLADYQKMKSLGANFQSIRVGAGEIGAWPGRPANASYLAKLDSMVALAKQAGIYSEFKLTMYDVFGFQLAEASPYWNTLWSNGSGAQDGVIAGYKRVWQRYVNEPYVVGYDLLNEPQEGTLNLSDAAFETQYLNPFYAKEIDQLRSIDDHHLAFFQPPLEAETYQVPLDRDRIVYAPHFYPNLRDYLAGKFVTTGYQSMMQRFLSEASVQKAPLYIGEYGMPWAIDSDGNATVQSKYVTLERTAVNLFLANNLSFTRPWFADDSAAVQIGGRLYGWGVIQGRNGLGGTLRTFITDLFTSAAKT
jgi:hypothetical protein